MSRSVLAFACGVLALTACGQSENKTAADSTAVATPPAAAPAPAPPANLSFAMLAGKWNLRVMAENSDSVLITETLTATATPAGWTVVRGNLKAEPVRPAVGGDSLITDGGPYPSALRKGVKVTTHTVWRMHGDTLVGATVAHYSKGPDTLRNLRVAGTRAQ